MENVKVPVENLIGAEGKGFQCIMANFNHEVFAAFFLSCLQNLHQPQRAAEVDDNGADKSVVEVDDRRSFQMGKPTNCL